LHPEFIYNQIKIDMKTPKYIFYLTAAAIVFASCEKKQGEGENKDTTKTVVADTTVSSKDTLLYKIDTTSSIVKWVGKKVTGDQHNGTVKVQSGELKLAGEKVIGGTVILDVNSIQDLDLTDKTYNQKLVGHLKGEDFFNVAKFPTATFVIISVDGNNAKGQLTIKEKTEEIVVPFETKVENGVVKATGKTTVDRTKWDIKYGSGKFFKNLGDKVISDEIALEFDIVGKK
jgi:polyisoprenoid-binding protein YceI